MGMKFTNVLFIFLLSFSVVSYGKNGKANMPPPPLVTHITVNPSLPASASNYTSLTKADGLFNAINTLHLSGNTTVGIAGNLTEDGVVHLTNAGLNGNTLVITTNINGLTVTGTNSGTGLIVLDGAIGVEFSASPGVTLIYANLSLTQPVFTLTNGVSDITIKNLTIQGAILGTSKGDIYIDQGLPNNANKNISIKNNIVELANSVSNIGSIGVYAQGDIANPSVNIKVDSNEIRNMRVGVGFENANDCEISYNSIYTTAAPDNLTEIGIDINNGKGNYFIEHNSIHGLISNDGLYGIIVNAEQLFLNNNNIYNIVSTGSANGSNTICGGIALIGYTGAQTHIVSNNEISISGSANNIAVVGIYDLGHQTDLHLIYYNSIFIGGNGSSPSYAYLRPSGSPQGDNDVVVKDNIFFNGRAGSLNYSASDENISQGNISFGYNLYVGLMNNTAGSGLGTVLFSDWQTQKSDFSSYNVSSGNLPASSLFSNTGNGNLTIKNNNPESWYVNGKGIAIPGITDDFNATAVRAGNVNGGATDIGADEFNPSVSPIAASITGVKFPGFTQTFSFAGRKLAELTWDAQSAQLPSTINLLYYSGDNPNDLNNGGGSNSAKYINGYWKIDASNDVNNNYKYDLKFFYDPAILRQITNQPNLIVNKRESGQTGSWKNYPSPQSIYNAIEKSVKVTGLTSFSEFTLTDAQATLPVILTSFSASPDKNNVNLSWQTTTETSNSHFILERSSNGQNFSELTKVNSKGNSSDVNNYNYTDYNSLKSSGSQLYYRLKIVSTSGSSSYSNVLMVKLSPLKNFTIEIAPNPFASQLNIIAGVPAAGKLQVRITDMNGKTLIQHLYDVTAGYNTLNTTGAASLSAGTYIAELSYNGQMLSKKVIKP